MKKMIALAILTSVASIGYAKCDACNGMSQPTPPQRPAGSATNYPDNARPGSIYDQFRTDEDRKLYKKIQDSILNDSNRQYRNVSVNINNGDVLLQGFVPTDGDRSAIESSVRNMSGVRNIDNQLMVRPVGNETQNLNRTNS